ncbi:MAG: hypothetical protein AAGI50_16900 [Pseudomonadota bacterium]
MNALTRTLLLGTLGAAMLGALLLVHEALISSYRMDAIHYTLPFG